jgi:ligand-binding sensor domain-containing protein
MRVALSVVFLGLICAGAYLVSGLASDYGPAGRPSPARVVAGASVPMPASVPRAAPTAQPVQTSGRIAPSELPPVRGKAGTADRPASDAIRFGVGERNVKRILLDGARVWVATSGGLISYAPESDEYRLYDARSGLPSSSLVYLGKLGTRIAASTLGGGLSLLSADGESWEHHGAGDQLATGVVSDVLRASGGDVWIATRAGAWRVAAGEFANRAAWTHFTAEGTRGGLPHDRVYGLAEGREGEIWFATEAGVARHRNGSWQSWRGLGGRPGILRTAAHADTAPDGAKADFVVSLACDGRGDVWAGTIGGGLTRFDGKAWSRYTTEDGLPGNNVLALHRDAGGRMWIGTDRGLARQQDGRFKVLTRRDGLYADAVFAVASAPEALWVGGFGGVARLRVQP